jgi:hypothetical protein
MCLNSFFYFSLFSQVKTSISNPEPDPKDPDVIVPLGSGSVIICTDTDPSISK